MSVLELVKALGRVDLVLYAVAFGLPIAVLVGGRLWPSLASREGVRKTLSALVALGLLTMLLAVMLFGVLRRRGTDLFADVPFLALLGPFVFGAGTWWAATRVVPFAELRRYPLLRRVWATLLFGAVAFAAVMILERTVVLVVTGLVGALIVGIILWSLLSRLGRRVTAEPPPEGDGELLDEVAGDSKKRLTRIADAWSGRANKP